VREIRRLAEAAAGATCDLRIVLTRGGCRLMLLETPVDTGAVLRLAFVTHSPSELLEGTKSLSYAGKHARHSTTGPRGADSDLLLGWLRKVSCEPRHSASGSSPR
jgi:hypothetical protein